jgi:hypothetical protein
MRGFLALGHEVATGANRWKEAQPVPSPGPRPPVVAATRPPTSPPPPARGWY